MSICFPFFFSFLFKVLARRELPRVLGKVYVLSGPVFLPHKVEEDPDKGLSRFRRGGPKQYLNHEVVGNVSVPTHLFKVCCVACCCLCCCSFGRKVYISIPNDNSPPLFSAFVVPNRPIKNKKLSEFQVRGRA